MSDEDDLDDIEPDQDDLEKEEEDKEMEEWEDYRKEGEEVSEEVRAWRRGPGAGDWGGRARGELQRDVFTACPPLTVDAHPPHGGHDEGRAFFTLQDWQWTGSCLY